MNHCTTCFKTLEPGINIGIDPSTSASATSAA